MWLLAVLVALLTARQVASSNTHKVLSNLDVVDYFLEHPESLPKNARIMFEEKARVLNKIQKRQSSTTVAILGSLDNSLRSLGKQMPIATVPSIQDGPSEVTPEARKKKIRYGPYRIPPVSENNVEAKMLQQQGMTNTLKIGARKPCSKNCMILNIVANLEYEDGKAVPSSPAGAWLHHLVLINVGSGVKDATCGGIAEHVFEAGNERSNAPYYSSPSGVKSGYHVRNEDIFVINTELMNMEDKEKWAWVTLTYDYVDKFDPEWKEGKLVWMSIGPNRCTGSEANPFGATNLTATQQPKAAKFVEYSVPWIAPADGLILGGNSHMHDGGTTTRFFMDENVICDSIPKYAKGAAAPEAGGHSHGDGAPGSMGGMAGMPMVKRQMGPQLLNAQIDHIAEQPACVFTKPVSIKKGQDVYIRADYDFTEHKGMRNKKGELDEVMAIAGLLVAFEFPLK